MQVQENPQHASADLEYVLTEIGRDLLPVVVVIRQWGEEYLFPDNEPRSIVLDQPHDHPLRRLEVLGVMVRHCNASDSDIDF